MLGCMARAVCFSTGGRLHAFTPGKFMQMSSLPLIPIQVKRFITTQGTLPRLTLYTKDPCPLCDEAIEVLQPLLEQVEFEKVDITAPENKEWWKAYRYDIPVFHFEGKFLMKHRANREMLEKALEDFYKDSSRD